MDAHPDSLLALFERYPELVNIIAARTDEEFDEGLEAVLEKAANFLEMNASHLAPLREDAISAFLVAYLSRPGLRVTQEAHSNGHVDITIEADISSPVRRRLGEAKIYDGPAYHVDGLKQLLDRYSTGRETSGLVIDYVKKKGIGDLVKGIRSYMDYEKPCLQRGESQDHRIKWAFATAHRHSSGEFIRVLHLNCNLYRPPGPR